jgi:endonuclease YncB( thermonuclease family)
MLPRNTKIWASALLSFFLLLSTASSQAEFFRWTDSQGNTHYSDKAAASSQKVTIQPGYAFYRIKKIYDGDTITLQNGERIRLLGINTPEIESRHKRAELGGIAAKKWLTKKLHKQKIRLEKDQEKRDKYGRLLAHLFTESGQHINLELVKNGLATANIHPPNLKYEKSLLSAQKEAEKSKQGIWGMTAYNPQSIEKIKSQKFHGWGRFTGKIISFKKGRKFDRLFFSNTIDLRIPAKNRALFPALKKYIGKQVEVRGWPSRRKSHYSILIRHPSAIITQ